MAHHPLKKILWAIDAFAGQELQSRAITALRAITRGSQAAIEPVYILTPDQVNISPDIHPDWVARYLPGAEKALKETLSESQLQNLLPPKIITDKLFSLRKAVEHLTSYAGESGADLIAASTHASTGVARLILGSFTETLLLHSKIPVFVVNPTARPADKIEDILFPTDFSAASRRGFEMAVGLARDLGARVTLYYKTLLPVVPAYQPIPNLAEYMNEEAEQRRKYAEGWIDWARKTGVTAAVVIDDSRNDVADAIVQYAEKKGPHLIAMVGQTGPIASAILGSVTRQVVRRAVAPIWVIHSKGEINNAKT